MPGDRFEIIGGTLGAYAVPYRGKRPHKPLKLPPGTVVEQIPPEMLRHLPDGLPANLELNRDTGEVLSAGPLAPGVSSVFVGFAGKCLLPDGRVAAVYGCRAEVVSIPFSPN